jgi:cytochrome bd-type quinol oxidase subunit 2
MTTADTSSENNTLIPQTEQPVVVQNAVSDDSMTGFFVAGVVINIVMISAFFIWAYKQWNKPGRPEN